MRDGHDFPELRQEAREVGVLGTRIKTADSSRTAPLVLEREADHERIDENRWLLSPDVNGDRAIPLVRWRAHPSMPVGILGSDPWFVASSRWCSLVRQSPLHGAGHKPSPLLLPVAFNRLPVVSREMGIRVRPARVRATHDPRQ